MNYVALITEKTIKKKEFYKKIMKKKRLTDASINTMSSEKGRVSRLTSRTNQARTIQTTMVHDSFIGLISDMLSTDLGAIATLLYANTNNNM